MKKARKFLAMLLCLTLCIVPLPFSVYAFNPPEISLLSLNAYADCPNCGSTHYYIIELSASFEDVFVGTPNVCYRRTYAAARMQCDSCSWIGTQYNVSKDFPHPTLIYGTEIRGQTPITAWHCPACIYFHY